MQGFSGAWFPSATAKSGRKFFFQPGKNSPANSIELSGTVFVTFCYEILSNTSGRLSDFFVLLALYDRCTAHAAANTKSSKTFLCISLFHLMK